MPEELIKFLRILRRLIRSALNMRNFEKNSDQNLRIEENIMPETAQFCLIWFPLYLLQFIFNFR